MLSVTKKPAKALSSCLQRRLLHRLEDRGYIKQVFPPVEKDKYAASVLSASRSVYCGFDPTADSLHIGNLLPLLLLIKLRDRGLEPIAIVGDITAQIGDPTGRVTERSQMEADSVELNVAGIRKNIETVFENYQNHFSKPTSDLPDLRIVRNSSWYSEIRLFDFLTSVGRHFRMGQMMSRESVRQRLSSQDGMSLAEFTYQSFQAYDWLQLFEKYGCALQIGGQDQLGNIDSGHDLIRRIHDKDSYGLLTPLIVSESGDKYGKSAGNAVWLTASKTPPYEVYQFLLRMTDSEAERMAGFFTFADDEELAELRKIHQTNPERRPLQNKIAEDLVVLLHGRDSLALCKRASELIFGRKRQILFELSEQELLSIFGSAHRAELDQSQSIDLLGLCVQCGLFLDEKNAARIISAGGLSVNLEKFTGTCLRSENILPSGYVLLKVGKRSQALVKIVR